MRFPAGNLIRLPFYFINGELAPAEEKRFFDRKRFDADPPDVPGLPLGMGYEPPEAVLELRKPGAADLEVVKGADVVEDAVGEYHAIVLADLDELGVWEYRGRALDAEGKPLAAGPWRTFTVY